MVTGDNRIILRRWLPTLRNAGEYKGDIVVIDYGIISHATEYDPDNATWITELKSKSVIVYTVTPPKLNFFIDRIRSYREFLLKDDNWKKYDVVMVTDGNDLLFYGSIQPLLDFAYIKGAFCYAREPEANTLRRWEEAIYSITNDNESKLIINHFTAIADNRIINAGMIVGPSKQILDYYNWILAMVKDVPSMNICDQQYLNVFIYFYNYQPNIEVGYEWNYIHDWIKLNNGTMIERIPIMRDGKAWAIEDTNHQIIIEHRTGASGVWCTPKGKELLKSGKDITNGEYEIR